MIGYLKGEVLFTEPGKLVLQTGGVGYEVYSVGFSARIGENIELRVYDHVRDDRRELYGFKDPALMRMFKKLIDISGVGTKLAQKILSAGSHDEIADRIIKGDLGFLTSISGVGTKTAQKIILELKGVLVSEEEGVEDQDTLAALMSLGYSRHDCIAIIRQVEGETVEERVRSALQLLGSE